ncbi:MAG: extracellular solute-binding protein [Chloroflexota bacterium]
MNTAQRSIIAILTLVLVLPATFSNRVIAQDQITVRMWMHADPLRESLDKELIAEFEKNNPSIKVEYTTFPDVDWDRTLTNKFNSKTGPDLFSQATFSIGQLQAQKLLAPVDSEAAGYKDQDAVYKAYAYGGTLLAGATFDGTLYGLPTEVNTYACYTNDDLWKKARLDPNKDFPTTWEAMQTTAEKLTVRDSSGALTQRGFDFPWGNSVFMLLVFNPMVQQLGSNMIDETGNSAAINTPEVKKVLGYWNDWANTWKLGGPQYPFTRDAFLAGKLAIDCDFGNWGAAEMKAAKINYSIHPIPVWKDAVGKNAFSIYAFYYLVNSNTDPKVQQAAWKLAGYLTSKPDRYWDSAELFQGKADYVASDAFKQTQILPIFLQEMSVSTYHPLIASFYEVADALMYARDQVVTSHQAIDDVLGVAQNTVTSILAKNKRMALK